MDAKKYRRFYWEVGALEDNTADSEESMLWRGSPGDLSALRRGIGREPGEVAAMWRFYTRLNENGFVNRVLRAEHITLGLFGIHQQGEEMCVHNGKTRLGTAMAQLRRDGYSSEAIDRRFVAAATANDIYEVAVHLGSLVRLLKTLVPTQRLNYTQLFKDLANWQDPNNIDRVRRQWGADYYLQQILQIEKDERKKNE